MTETRDISKSIPQGRPRWFSEFVGQTDIIARLRQYVAFYSFQRTTPGHIMLTAEDGMGQSRIATIFANERDKGFQWINASDLLVQGDLTAILTDIRENQILLLSNIHLLRKQLFPPMREALQTGKLWIKIGQGKFARMHHMDVKPFTLIATCPRQSDCPAELRESFSLNIALQPYSLDELALIAERIAENVGLTLAPDAARLVVKHCEHKPGSVKTTVSRLAVALNQKNISEDDVRQVFAITGTKVQADTTLPYPADDMSGLSGQDFEKLITSLLTRMGFHAEMTRTTGDGGVDIVAVLDKPIVGGRYLFQCKRFAPDNLVGSPTVRDFYGAVMADRAVKGILIATSDFTAQAQEFGEKAGVELINLTRLEGLLREHGLIELEN